VLILRKIEIAKTIGLIATIIVIIFLIMYIFVLKTFFKVDNDYQKLGLELDTYNIDYYTVYDEDFFSIYKVYKLNIFRDKDEIRNELEDSSLWSKDKFYEYVMMRFYEEINEEIVEIDRENLYYYHENGIYSIFDIKNAKLYYLKNYLYSTHSDYSTVLEIKVKDYIEREIYDVRGGLQNDGRDYYVYKFTGEKGKEIIETIEQNSKWSKNRLDEDKLDNFEYNEEILSIENGYYYYELVCRTRDENKKKNVTKENATGYEIGVYDADKNILYYCWESI
jgi:hypothetical protein